MIETERYRQNAEECRRKAATVLSPLDKEAWLKLAEEWLALAEFVERRERPVVNMERAKLGPGSNASLERYRSC